MFMGIAMGNFIEMLLRFLHFFFGVMWIGHLYYFNFTQGTFLNDAEIAAGSKTDLRRKLLPAALYYFRWGAMWTVVTGVLYWSYKAHTSGAGFNVFLQSSYGWTITSGMILGLIMWYNVWFVIWPKQQIVIKNAEGLAKSQPANPDAAAAGARANVASRTNTLFSIPLLYLMGAASHFPLPVSERTNYCIFWIPFLLIVAALEWNALKGQTRKIMTTIPQVVHFGILLTIIIIGLMFAAV